MKDSSGLGVAVSDPLIGKDFFEDILPEHLFVCVCDTGA